MNFDKLIIKLRKENAPSWATASIDEFSEKIYESDKLNLVCELIQNANDSYANKVCFVVKSDEINLYHDGNPFNEIDITKISSKMSIFKCKIVVFQSKITVLMCKNL